MRASRNSGSISDAIVARVGDATIRDRKLDSVSQRPQGPRRFQRDDFPACKSQRSPHARSGIFADCARESPLGSLRTNIVPGMVASKPDRAVTRRSPLAKRRQDPVEAVGRRYDFQVPVPQQTEVGGYSTASLASSYDVSDQLTLFVRADNLLNQRYHEFIGFPNFGICARAGVRYRFR